MNAINPCPCVKYRFDDLAIGRRLDEVADSIRNHISDALLDRGLAPTLAREAVVMRRRKLTPPAPALLRTLLLLLLHGWLAPNDTVEPDDLPALEALPARVTVRDQPGCDYRWGSSAGLWAGNGYGFGCGYPAAHKG